MSTMKMILSVLLVGLAGMSFAAATDDFGVGNNSIDLINLDSHNTVVLRGPVMSSTVDDVVKRLMQVEAEDIYLVIVSPGGSVIDGYRVMQTINALRLSGKRVHGVALQALSMGFVILQSCDTRYVIEGSVLMQHQMSGGNRGPIQNMNARMDFSNFLYDRLCRDQAERLGMTTEQFKDRINDDWWLFSDQCVDENAADRVADVLCSAELLDNVDVIRYYTFFGPVDVSYSRCPLIFSPVSIQWGNEGENHDNSTCIRPDLETMTIAELDQLIISFLKDKNVVLY